MKIGDDQEIQLIPDFHEIRRVSAGSRELVGRNVAGLLAAHHLDLHFVRGNAHDNAADSLVCRQTLKRGFQGLFEAHFLKGFGRGFRYGFRRSLRGRLRGLLGSGGFRGGSGRLFRRGKGLVFLDFVVDNLGHG